MSVKEGGRILRDAVNNTLSTLPKLYDIIAPNIANSALAELMQGKRITLKKDKKPLPPPLPSLVTKLAGTYNPANIFHNLQITESECKLIEIATHIHSR